MTPLLIGVALVAVGVAGGSAACVVCGVLLLGVKVTAETVVVVVSLRRAGAYRAQVAAALADSGTVSWPTRVVLRRWVLAGR